MKFTGERYIPTEQGKIRLEHYHRYTAVLDIVSGKDVLDIACGEGYGSALMSKEARSVTGLDISDEVVQHATHTYSNIRNLTFLQGNAITLEFEDASFDVVVSFETIEHLIEQAQMLVEIRRVLRPKGVLVMSSPNRPVYSEESGEHNQFHVKELDFNEFDELLKSQFPAVQYYGQRMMMGSVIQSIQGGQSAYKAWHDDGTSIKPMSSKLSEPVYFVAICGEDESNLPVLDSSVVYPDQLDLVKHYVGFAKWAKSLEELVTERDEEIANLNQTVSERDTEIVSLNQLVTERDDEIANLNQTVSERDTEIVSLNQLVTERDDEIANLNQTVSERDTEIASLNQLVTERDEEIANLNQTVSERDTEIVSLTDETVRRGEWALRLDAELQETQAKLIVVTQSNSWYLTKPLREVRRWITQPGYQSHRYVRASLRLMKRGYQSLSLSAQIKAKHRYLLSKTFPKLLLLSGSHPSTIPALSVPINHQSQPILDPVTSQQGASVVIALPTSDEPLVSVIIPIYGKVEYTLHCLDSIAKNPPEATFEVIVVDDCSPDNSVDALQQVQGVRLIQNAENQGFIRSCNIGTQAAKGEYLLFLNNDTQVMPGWLDELLRTFDEFPGTGLAGSKLIYPDGRLQEAGGIIWQDGSAWNFGRFQDPDLPVYNYAREVDYCSGASIMVPKSLFFELGGFDEHYLPAYCEDSDLALKIRNKGYRVIYQPMSTVIHFEGITSGTDTSKDIKAYQVENTKKLYDRWKKQLQVYQPPGIDVDNAKDRKAKFRALVLDHCTPTPDQDAGSVTVFNLLLLLREMDFQVTFIPEDNFLYMPRYTTALQRAGIEVLYAPHCTSVVQHLKESGQRYDLAFLFRPGVVERHLEVIHEYCPNTKVLYHTVDLHFLRMQREADLLNDDAKRKQAMEMKQRELMVIRSCDASIVHSTAELEFLRPELPEAKLHVFPLIMDVRGTEKGFTERRDIVFIGGYQHAPNVDAVKFMVNEIMPLLRQRLPGIRFYAVGSKPPEEIQKLASEDVIITGFVEDLNPLLDKMRVSVAPLRYGAGIKGKIGTAMAVGLPVVATSLAVEGMSLTIGENILVADKPQAFADTVAQLYQDEALWNKLSKTGVEFADSVWGAESAWKTLADILEHMGLQMQRSLHPLRLYRSVEKDDSEEHRESGLIPILVVRNRKEYEKGLQMSKFSKIQRIERLLIETSKVDAFTVDGFCVPCSKKVPFLVDMQSGGQIIEGKRVPNWRERLVCPHCQMNNWQRLMATLISQHLKGHEGKKVYFMEQVTPIYQWAVKAFPKNKIIGSEYLGHKYKSGQIVRDIRHEDVENLSFLDGELDLIISNDVFEHVPHPEKAFAECSRVLKLDGTMLATIPFHQDSDASIKRAEIIDGELKHHLSPEYHGNPVSESGSLVFTDFGWDMLEVINRSGFSDASVAVFASADFGHLGGGELIFQLTK